MRALTSSRPPVSQRDVSVVLGARAFSGAGSAILRGSSSVSSGILPRRLVRSVRRRSGSRGVLGPFTRKVAAVRRFVAEVCLGVAPVGRDVALLAYLIAPLARLIALLSDLVTPVGGQVTLVAGQVTHVAHQVAPVGGVIALTRGVVPHVSGVIADTALAVSQSTRLIALITGRVARVADRALATRVVNVAGRLPFDQVDRRLDGWRLPRNGTPDCSPFVSLTGGRKARGSRSLATC
jgi:hypothetical protein